MPESSPYPGSPSLSNEAREKVRQTFRHTIQLAKSGRNEEALLGCDFILKMDARFQPARRLLETLRGVASGTVVDLSPFADYLDGAGGSTASAPAVADTTLNRAPAAAADDTAARRARAGEDTATKRAAAAPASSPATGSLDDLAFDDFAMSDPFAAPGGPGSAQPRMGAAAPPPAAAPPRAPAMPPPAAAPAFPESDFALGDMPELPPPSTSSPFAPAAPPPSSPTPPPSAAVPMPPPSFEPPSPASSGTSVDPRISQFLKQGDEALGRGQIQEAIDLWSRVFLIDLSNEEASQRIDAARERQAETARKIDMLLSEGITQYDGGDLAGARAKFLDVLALSESDSTARSYLNQIDAAMSERSGPISPPPARESYPELGVPDAPSYEGSEPAYLPDELSMPGDGGSTEPSTLSDEELAPSAPAPAARTVKVDARIFLALGLLVVIAIGGGAYFLLKKRGGSAPAPPPVASRPAKRPGPQGAPAPQPGTSEDVIARANALIDQGKVEEARALVTSIPDSDPRYPSALEVMERIRNAAVPTPGPSTAETAATLDEKRVAGIAAAKSSHYIDAVKALDPVVKAHPDDAEAAALLTKSREQVAAMGAAVKAYNEQDYQTAIKLLWDLRRKDAKNQDVEDFLFRAYFNDAIQDLQAGNSGKAAESFKEASALRPGDNEAKRHLSFVKKYAHGATDLLSRIYIKHLAARP